MDTLITLASKTYRRDWAQAQALAKLREMKGEGMSNVAIADQIGVSDVFIGRILRKENPDPISENVWNGLIKKAGFVPAPPGREAHASRTESIQSMPLPPDALSIIARLEQSVSGLLAANVMLTEKVERLLKKVDPDQER